MESRIYGGLSTHTLKRTGLAGLFATYTRLFENSLLQTLGGDHAMTASTLVMHTVGDIAICLGVSSLKDKIASVLGASDTTARHILYIFAGGVLLNYMLHLGMEPLYHALSDSEHHGDIHIHDEHQILSGLFAFVVGAKVFTEELTKFYIFKR